MEPLVFRSRIDPWLAAVTFGPVVLAGGMVVRRAIVTQRAPGVVLIAMFGVALGLLLWVFLATTYRITSRDLLVRSGPLRITVPLSEIGRVRRTRSVLSAPALSLRRLEVSYGKHSQVVISPADEEGFLTALRERAPGFELSASEP